MDYNKYYELSLHNLTCHELLLQRDDLSGYKKQYEDFVIAMLDQAECFEFETDVLSKYNRGNSLQDIEGILEDIPWITPMGVYLPNPANNNHPELIYFDTAKDMVIETYHMFYDRFFAYLMKHTDLLKVDYCLAYQLNTHHGGDLVKFSRFLHLVIRKFKGKIIPEETVLTMQEWIADFSNEMKVRESDATKDQPRRGRINRRSGDNVTSLSREQTILLIQYFKEFGIILKDEYLTDLEAGKAFEILTGFSQNTIRQDLGKYYMFQTKDNLHKVLKVMNEVTSQIDKQLADS